MTLTDGLKDFPTKMQATHVSDAAAIITNPSKTYDLKFFFKFPKKFGPAIKPTEVTKNISPRFSTTFSASPVYVVSVPLITSCASRES